MFYVILIISTTRFQTWKFALWYHIQWVNDRNRRQENVSFPNLEPYHPLGINKRNFSVIYKAVARFEKVGGKDSCGSLAFMGSSDFWEANSMGIRIWMGWTWATNLKEPYTKWPPGNLVTQNKLLLSYATTNMFSIFKTKRKAINPYKSY